MQDFQWGNIWAISWIAVVFIAGVFIVRGDVQKSKILRKLIDFNLFGNLIKGYNKKIIIFKHLLLIIALFLLVISLMEPKYDFTWETIDRKGIDIIIALDVSKSMLASDIKPSRIERSRLEVKNFINNLKGDRVGLIIFTSKAITQCPLTLDYSTYKTFLDEIEVGFLPKGGTSLSSAIDQAVISFDSKYKKHRALIIVTDGESHDSRLDESIKRAKENDINIFTVGLGSKEGAPIILPSQKGEQIYLKDSEGNLVQTKLNEDNLVKVSLETNGAYIHADSGNFSLEKIYNENISVLEGRNLQMTRKQRYKHRFYIPLALAILLIILDSFISEKK